MIEEQKRLDDLNDKLDVLNKKFDVLIEQRDVTNDTLIVMSYVIAEALIKDDEAKAGVNSRIDSQLDRAYKIRDSYEKIKK